MVQVHVPQGVGVRVPPWAPTMRKQSSLKRAFFSSIQIKPTSKAPLCGRDSKAVACTTTAGSRYVTELTPLAPTMRKQSSLKRAFFSPIQNKPTSKAPLCGRDSKAVACTATAGSRYVTELTPWAPTMRKQSSLKRAFFRLFKSSPQAKHRFAGGTRKLWHAKPQRGRDT
jgi:hypothetical protein